MAEPFGAYPTVFSVQGELVFKFSCIVSYSERIVNTFFAYLQNKFRIMLTALFYFDNIKP